MAAGEVKPVYVLYGDDAFLRDEHRKAVVAQIIGDSDPQLAVSAFDADAELAVVLDELRTVPFLAPRRAVIIKDGDSFVTAHRSELEDYLQSPSTNSSLVLVVSSWPRTTKLFKLVEKIGQSIDCSPPDERNLPRWIKDAAARAGKKIDTQAAQLLAQWRGADLASLQNELEKLSLYVDQRQSITVDDVSRLVVATSGVGAYDLTNAISAGDTAGALRALASMLSQRGEEFKLLGMLASHMRKMLYAAQLVNVGLRMEDALSQSWGGRGWFPREALAMLRRRPLPKLQNDFRRLLRADLSLKSGSEPQAVLQELVVELCT